MRVVIDTNILVSAFLWHGLPGELIELAGDKTIQPYTSRVLIEELASVLTRKKLAKQVAATGLSAAEMISHFRRLVTMVSAPALPQQVSRDPDDDAVLACALAARADLIISGDADLLSLKTFQAIPIVTVAQALKQILG